MNRAEPKVAESAGATAWATGAVPGWARIGVVVGAAVFMGLAIVAARVAYLGGTNVVTVLAVRFVLMATVLAVVTRVLGVSLALPRPLILPVLGLAVTFAATAYDAVDGSYFPVVHENHNLDTWMTAGGRRLHMAEAVL